MAYDPKNPQADDYRITKGLMDEEKRWIWKVDIDGRWVFTRAVTEEAAATFVAPLHQIAEDDTYTYWRK